MILIVRGYKIHTNITLHWRHNECDGVSNRQPHDCLLDRLFRRRSKKTSKLRVTGLCVGNLPVTGEFPTQRASNAENVSIWWRHHDLLYPGMPLYLLLISLCRRSMSRQWRQHKKRWQTIQHHEIKKSVFTLIPMRYPFFYKRSFSVFANEKADSTLLYRPATTNQ